MPSPDQDLDGNIVDRKRVASDFFSKTNGTVNILRNCNNNTIRNNSEDQNINIFDSMNDQNVNNYQTYEDSQRGSQTGYVSSDRLSNNWEQFNNTNKINNTNYLKRFLKKAQGQVWIGGTEVTFDRVTYTVPKSIAQAVNIVKDNEDILNQNPDDFKTAFANQLRICSQGKGKEQNNSLFRSNETNMLYFNLKQSQNQNQNQNQTRTIFLFSDRFA